jgi:hypothetical protein
MQFAYSPSYNSGYDIAIFLKTWEWIVQNHDQAIMNIFISIEDTEGRSKLS